MGVADLVAIYNSQFLLSSLQDIGVGKSSLVGRFVHNSFNPNLTTTLGYG